MAAVCSECGAALVEGSTCRDHFHALLLLEWQIPGGPGALAHLLAVGTYGLQHPQSMNYTEGALHGLRQAVADALAGRATIEDLRQRARQGAAKGRITRRPGDAVVQWPVGDWPLCVTDVLTVAPEPAAYFERVSEWARSVVQVLDGVDR